jgi:DNA-binding GntR family transcriptional regulator
LTFRPLLGYHWPEVKHKSIHPWKTPEAFATRQDAVLGRLRDAIVTGELEPGSRLVQEELAAQSGVRRIPLREDLRTLEGEGLVIIEPNRGAVCRPLEPKDLVDLYEVRLCLERFAVRTSAERFADLRARTADLKRSAHDAIERHDFGALIEADSVFHHEIARASGNEHLLRSLDISWSQIMRAMHYFLSVDRYPQNVWADHQALARAIALGDAQAAQALIESHILNSRNVILNYLKETEYRRAAGA